MLHLTPSKLICSGFICLLWRPFWKGLLYSPTWWCLPLFRLLQEQYQFLYEALGGVYPVQNGEVKAVQASACDSIQVVNETKADEPTAEEEKVEQPGVTTSATQQAAAETTPLVVDGEKEEKKEETEKETTPLTDSAVTVEV